MILCDYCNEPNKIIYKGYFYQQGEYVTEPLRLDFCKDCIIKLFNGEINKMEQLENGKE